MAVRVRTCTIFSVGRCTGGRVVCSAGSVNSIGDDVVNTYGTSLIIPYLIAELTELAIGKTNR